MKDLENIVGDIYKVVDSGADIDKEDMDYFLNTMRDELTSFLSKKDRGNTYKPTIRMSNIGKLNRKMWYDFHTDKKDDLKPTDRIKFFYGHMLEAFVLFLCRISGHDVKDYQKEVELEGVKGHIDAIIDDVVVDVKSASSYSFSKFDRGYLFENDPFGYISQISGYAEALNMEKGAFLAIDKQYGKLALLPIEDSDMIDASRRIRELKTIVDSDEIPERCYNEVIEDNGNRSLCTDCGWCEYKYDCWSHTNNGAGLRAFKYQRNVKYLTHVEKEPRVEEIL